MEEEDYSSWSLLGEEGKRIEKILAGVNQEYSIEAFERWKEYLEENITFPFEAVVWEGYEKGPLHIGDNVSVKKLSSIVEPYGIMAEVRKGKKKCYRPLCDLKVLDEDSHNYQPVKDYAIWYANI